MSRSKQTHTCYACTKPTDHFVRVKRKVNYVKQYVCEPECNFAKFKVFLAKDTERVNGAILKVLARSSPWLDLIKNP